MRPLTDAFGSYRPRIASASNVLPEPEAPTTATISPTWTEMLNASITRDSTFLAPKNEPDATSYIENDTVRSSTCKR